MDDKETADITQKIWKAWVKAGLVNVIKDEKPMPNRFGVLTENTETADGDAE